MTGLLVICAVTIAYCMLGKRLASTIVTAPVIFLALGAVTSVSGLIPPDRSEQFLHPVAEVALVILLFIDAAQTDLRALRERSVWPRRMLLIGLPLAIVFGAAVNFVFFPGWPVMALLLAAAILAPTDAALGQAVVTNTDVPIRPRRALTVESGLNDGLALPLVLLFASLTAETMAQSNGEWLLFGAKQVILGPLAGIVMGWMGGVILIAAKERDLTSKTFEGIAALSMAGISYIAATQIGGNGFISAFVSGLVFGAVVNGRCDFVYEFIEGDGQLVAWLAFLLLGAALVPEAITHLTWPMVAVIVISLFIVRPLAIWISLMGTDATPLTRVFFGWFGPRGLATALFALLIFDMIPHQLGDTILHLAVNTVWISAVLHGVSAAPAARWYGEKVSQMGACAEMQSVPPSPQKSKDLTQKPAE